MRDERIATRSKRKSTKQRPEKNNQGLRERKRFQRQYALLMAAARVFRQTGYDNARVTEIALVADVSPGTVYNYFPTKESLLLGIVDYYFHESLDKRMVVVKSPPAAPVEAFYQYYSILLNHSLTYLDKSVWRHVQSANILTAWEQVGADFMESERVKLGEQLEILRKLRKLGVVSKSVDLALVAETIHSVGYFGWQSFLAEQDMSVTHAKNVMRSRLEFLFSQKGFLE